MNPEEWGRGLEDAIEVQRRFNALQNLMFDQMYKSRPENGWWKRLLESAESEDVLDAEYIDG